MSNLSEDEDVNNSRNIPMKTKNAGAKPLNVRQERFADGVASGLSDVQAYIAAGYTKSEKNARTNAWRVRDHEGVNSRIVELKGESKSWARKTKGDKLALLEGIAWANDSKRSDVIAALKVHNEMTGDNEPTVTVVDLGAKTLDMVRERMRAQASPLARAAK